MDDSFERPNFTNSLRQELPVVTRKRKRTKLSSPTPASSLPLNPSPSLENGTFSSLWIDEFAPNSPGDLVIHKDRIEQLRRWITSGYRIRPILCIIGPTGSGKFTALSVLSKQLDLRLVEWHDPYTDPSFTMTSPELDVQPSKSDMHYPRFTSISQMFMEFLMQGTKYARPNDLLLVRSFPLFTYESLERVKACFTRILHRTSASSTSTIGPRRLVLMFTDFTMPPDLAQEARNQQNMVGLILKPSQIIPTPCLGLCETITFNPVAPTFIKKALHRILALQKHERLAGDHALLNTIVEESRGDLRQSVNILQYASLIPEHAMDCVSSKDLVRSVFSELGHLLYNKRDTNLQRRAVFPTQGDDFGGLPNHLKPFHRPFPITDLHGLLERLPVSKSTFGWMLHANAPFFFTTLASLVFMAEQYACSDGLPGPHGHVVQVYAIALAHGMEDVVMDHLEGFWDDEDLEEGLDRVDTDADRHPPPPPPLVDDSCVATGNKGTLSKKTDARPPFRRPPDDRSFSGSHGDARNGLKKMRPSQHYDVLQRQIERRSFLKQHGWRPLEAPFHANKWTLFSASSSSTPHLAPLSTVYPHHRAYPHRPTSIPSDTLDPYDSLNHPMSVDSLAQLQEDNEDPICD